MAETIHHTCTLCEAGCGLSFEVEDNRIQSVRPDEEDVFSKGFVCPKGVSIADLENDPDRLRTPVRRDSSGSFQPISWADAFDLVGERLQAIQREHGRDAVGIYVGNPIVHNTGAVLLYNGLLRALGSRNSYSAGSQDTSPRNAASYYLYGSSWAIPIPDLDRTDYFLCLGANPYISNGSFLTAPNVRGRIRGIQKRGGKVVVVDPRRTETAREADEHVAILPGGDAALLLGMVRVLLDRGCVDRDRIRAVSRGWDEVERLLSDLPLERAARLAGVDASTIERLALEFYEAPTAVAYSRVGVCNNRHGTLATWATDLLNLAANRMGEIGGALFASPAIDLVEVLRLAGADGHDRWRSRVRGLPETYGALPSAAMAEEMETPGPGQIRGFITYAGNPVLSTPNGRRLAAALGKLDFMVSIDLYVNETTRHADVILPSAWSLAEDHLDVVFPNFAVRNVVRWSPPVVRKAAGERVDWEILLELAERLGGGPTGIGWLDHLFRLGKKVGLGWEPTRTLGLLLRTGRYGDRFLPWSKGLNLRRLAEAPHGVDLGPLEPGFARRVLHRDKRIHVGAKPMLDALRALSVEGERGGGAGELLLVGRRETHSNNSWMHNVASLVSGRERCVLFIHPRDAAAAGVRDGDVAVLESRVHRGDVRVRLTDDLRPGVMSLPHGWGHAASAPWQQVASRHAGVSFNDWADDAEVESIVGQSILNGVPVRLLRKEAAEPEARVA